MQRYIGIFEALLSATLFGLIPFFFIPLYQNGFGAESTLAYRFIMAALMTSLFALFKRKSLYISPDKLIPVVANAFIYFVATLFLFLALTYMPSGIVTTIFFTNPIFVMILMIVLYKERLERYKIVLSLSTCIGVALLSGFFTDISQISLTGLTYCILAAICYGSYVVGLFKLQSYNISTEAISVWIFTTCGLAASIYAVFSGDFQVPSSSKDWYNLFGLALVTVVLANVLLIKSIKKIGSVLVAILGAMEPITAVLVGIVVFHEVMNFQILIGILIVIVSVILLTIMPILRAGNSQPVSKKV